MEAIGLFFTKFSEELLNAQIALLAISLALGIYWMLVRKKKRETEDWVPAALVRAYLDRMRSDERETRIRLFGESAGMAYTTQPTGMPITQMISGVAAPSNIASNDPALVREIEALRSQLAMTDARAMEFDRTMNGLRAEKTLLEQKVKDALAAAAANSSAGASAGPSPAAVKEMEELRAKLQEYEVIEDDLANLKKFQKENEQLRQKLSQMEGGATALTSIAQDAAAPQVAVTVSGVTQKIDTPVTVIGGAKAPSPAEAPAAVAESNTNVLAPLMPMVDTGAPAPAAAAPAADKSSKQKEEELLSEFEKMLAS